MRRFRPIRRTGSRRTVVRRRIALGLMLTVAVIVVPDAGLSPTVVTLVKVDSAKEVDHDADVVWVLALGSDARPGEDVLRSRADAIQLVGLNLESGRGVVIGIPRDSWVSIPGVGSDRINAGLYYGGPPLMGQAVEALTGVRPDYVVTTSFVGFRAMVQRIGGIVVDSRLAFTDDNMPGEIRQGWNRLNGFEALFFSRARHYLPRGDFDRSANQQEALRGILRRVRSREDEPGFMERGMYSVLKHLHTDLGPRELYRLAQAATQVVPSRLVGCVVDGSIGDVNGASVVFPDTAMAQRLGSEARDDAEFDQPC